MLPSNWIAATLGDVVRYGSGGTPSRQNPEYWNGTLSWFSAKDLKSFRLIDSEEHITEAASKSGTRVVDAGTILVLVRGMTLLKSFPVGITTKPSAFNQDLRAVFPCKSLDCGYLAYWLVANEKKVLSLVDQAGHGTGRLATDRLSELEITYPSDLAEQRRIARCLETWTEAESLIVKLIASKVHTKQGLVQQLLSGEKRLRNRAVAKESPINSCDKGLPGPSATAIEVERGLNGVSHDKGIPRLGGCPDGWRTRRLRELLSIVERPIALQPDKTYKLVTAKRYRAGIVPREVLCGSQIKTATQFETKSGDFLISRRQIIHGACGLVPPPLDGAVVSNEYSCLRVSDELDPTFCEYLAHTKYLQRTFYQSSVGVALEKMIFRIDKWLDYEIHLPPLPEQQRIVAVLTAIDREIVLLDRLQKAVAKQKKGLMQKLLTGQVRVKLSKGDTDNIPSHRSGRTS